MSPFGRFSSCLAVSLLVALYGCRSFEIGIGLLKEVEDLWWPTFYRVESNSNACMLNPQLEQHLNNALGNSESSHGEDDEPTNQPVAPSEEVSNVQAKRLGTSLVRPSAVESFPLPWLWSAQNGVFYVALLTAAVLVCLKAFALANVALFLVVGSKVLSDLSLFIGTPVPAKNENFGRNDNDEINCKRLASCRIAIVRLLGLVGAGPPSTSGSISRFQKAEQSKQISVSALVEDEACRVVIDFTRAHVVLLLTIDRVFHWLRCTSSLHLGLGPHSQCIERVERCQLAKHLAKEKNDRVEVHRDVSKSIVALTSVRRTLALILVRMQSTLFRLEDKIQNSTEEHADDETQALPTVVSLSWIKLAREDAAQFLSLLACDSLVTISGMQLLSRKNEVLEYIQQATDIAHEQTQYLRALLLLDDSSVERAMTASPIGPTRQSVASDSRIELLMEMRKRLDVLQSAVWACQHALLDVNTCSDHKQNDARQWWEQVTSLMASMRPLEDELTLLLTVGDESNDDTITEVPNTEALSALNEPDTGKYEDDGSSTVHLIAQKPCLDRTLVFSGSGEITRKQPLVARVADLDQPLPARDMISEQLLMNELQVRVKSLQQPPEEEVISQERSTAPSSKDGGLPGHEAAGGHPPKSSSIHTPLSFEPTRPSTGHGGSSQDIPFFLGASGSLLDELKRAMISATEDAPT